MLDVPIGEGNSDSQDLNRTIETLIRRHGLSLAEAMEMVVPPIVDEIAALYGRLLEFEPSPVVEANRAVALAAAHGPEAGLLVLDALAQRPELARWPQLHLARAELLARMGRSRDAVAEYRTALAFETARPARRFIGSRIALLDGGESSPGAESTR